MFRPGAFSPEKRSPFGQSGLNSVQPLHYPKWLLERCIASCSSGLSHVDSYGLPGEAGTGPSGLLGAGLTKSALAALFLGELADSA